jgi:hypothetical protein
MAMNVEERWRNFLCLFGTGCDGSRDELLSFMQAVFPSDKFEWMDMIERTPCDSHLLKRRWLNIFAWRDEGHTATVELQLGGEIDEFASRVISHAQEADPYSDNPFRRTENYYGIMITDKEKKLEYTKDCFHCFPTWLIGGREIWVPYCYRMAVLELDKFGSQNLDENLAGWFTFLKAYLNPPCTEFSTDELLNMIHTREQ